MPKDTDQQLIQLEMFAQTDELIRRLTEWIESESQWEPLDDCRALIRRLLERVQTLRIRMEAPLVVATFGGTGTGKSALVNALVGIECSPSGRQRPTTTRPTLIVHPETEIEVLDFPVDDMDIVRHDAPILRDIMILDCPDPDTTEVETQGTNLQRLHQLLPHCDVLIYTTTQQKYRSASVTQELADASAGCRLLFVQTHADLDEDIRDDWRKQLVEHYDVAELFFVDSVRAFNEQQAGKKASGDFGRLYSLLMTRLAASERLQIRRANLLDVVSDALEHCRDKLAEKWPAVSQLESALEEQRQKLTQTMSHQLRDELQSSRNLWERRLVSSVTQKWGFSPFSTLLRTYNGLGGLIASMSFYRARTTAQIALIGVVQGSRWLRSKRQEKDAVSQFERLASLQLDDAVLRESQLVIAGHVQEARLDPALAQRRPLEHLRNEAARVEGDFLSDASRRIDTTIDELADRKSGFLVRGVYELLFVLFIGFVLFRVGKNFFVDSLLNEKAILTIDFYIPAGVFFLLWSGLLVMLFTGRLRRGLTRTINELVNALVQNKLSHGLFPELEQECRDIQHRREQLDAIASRATELRSQIAKQTDLGAQKIDVLPPISSNR